MARPELGLKRQCMNCGAKFYDLSRDPAVCPKCGTVSQGATAITRVAAPVAARSRPAPAAEEPEIEAAGPELVSLDEVEASENAAEGASEDVDLAEDVGTEDAFLEEEEEGEDDVTGLIDGDIEDDEES